jgi:transcriptional regulator with XRE-family HTH domain
MTNERLRQARKDLGFSQEDVADEVNISQQTYSRIEAGTGPIKARKAFEIAEMLKQPVANLFPGLVDLARDDLDRLTNDFSSDGVDIAEQLERAGVDVDENDRTIYWSRPGAGTNFARVSGATARRILRELEYSQSSDFVVFDSASHRVAIRMDAHVVKVSSQAAGAYNDSYDGSTLDGRGDVVEIWREGASHGDEVAVQPDAKPIGNTAAWSIEHQVQHLFQEIWNKAARVRLVSRIDDEVEAVFYPKRHIVSVTASLSLLPPRSQEKEDEAPEDASRPRSRFDVYRDSDALPATPMQRKFLLLHDKDDRGLARRLGRDEVTRAEASDRMEKIYASRLPPEQHSDGE